MTPRTDAPRRAVAALVLAAAAVLPLAGCDAVQSLGGGSSTTTTSAAGPTSATPDPSASATAGNSASPAPELTPPPVAGYQYTDAPPQVSTQVGNVGKQFGGIFTGATARGVTRGGKTVAAVVLYGIDDSVTGTKEFDDKLLGSILSGLAGQGGASKREVIGDQAVVSATPKQGTGIIAWYKDSVITMVLGADPAEARQYTTQYLKAA